jgi:hypothetical protein
MYIHKALKRFGLLLSAVLLVFGLSAQTTITASLTADSTHILIGDHLKVRLALKHPKNSKITIPVAKDSIGNMELISVSKIDTFVEATDEIYSQTYTVSAFDSGQFHAGPVIVPIQKSPGVFDTLLSNMVIVDVATLPVDTMRPFKPIKGPLSVPYSWREFIPYIAGGIILLILIGLGIYFWRKYQKEKPVIAARPVPKDPAHIWARKELKKLDDEKLWQKDEIKAYYSRLTEILRLYLEYRFKWLALESTTEEIEDAIGDYITKEKAKDNLLQILRMADLVKFAKQQPTPDANIKAMESAYKFIDLTEPKEEETKKS